MNDEAEKERWIETKMLDAVSEVVRGTDWAPPDGGILVDVLVVMMHVDGSGEHGISWVTRGSKEQAEGMARAVVRDIEQTHQLQQLERWNQQRGED